MNIIYLLCGATQHPHSSGIYSVSRPDHPDLDFLARPSGGFQGKGDPGLRKATDGDIPAITGIHQAAFHDAFLTQLGAAFLKIYYELVLNYSGGILLVNEGPDGLKGFVAGFLHPREFYRLMLRNSWRLAVPTLLALLRRPWLTGRVVYNLCRLRQVAPDATRPACELSSVAVRPSISGRGVGRELIEAFLQEAWITGARYVYLTTDADYNENTNRLYCKLGFRLQRTFRQYKGRYMNEYVISSRFAAEAGRSES